MCRKLLGVFLVVSLLCSSAWAVSLLGPATAGLEKGNLGVGFNYAHSKTDAEASLGAMSAVVEDLTSDSYLASIGYGVSDNWELYGLIGVATGQVEDFEGDLDLAFGIGTKITLLSQDKFSLGTMLQLTCSRAKDSIDFGSVTVEGEADWYEFVFAVGPKLDLTKNISIYGGGMVYFLDGDLDIEAMGYSASVNLETGAKLGGYVGAQIDLGTSISSYVEYQILDNSQAIAAGVRIQF